MVNLVLDCGEFEGCQEDRIDRTRYGHPGVQYIFSFANGYGASVIKHRGSYGYKNDLWELAVLDSDGELTYDTPITNDVIGHLTDEEVRDILTKIRELPDDENYGKPTAPERH